jgi:Subtilisin-like serine proteases
VQGDGIVVANIDTGVQYNHPALDQAFKCASPSDAACWADPSNICGGSACDNNGHGTHTMGTMVGDDDPTLTYQVGMAPNAKWIACKGCESSSCSDTALNACADWILAPGGNPANRPNIVNNSWGGGGGDTWYLAKVQAWRAAGIFPAFSAGNSGSSCGTIGSPSDYQESFATANHMSGRTINSGSSRGPSTYGHEPYTKPNISAPGTSICSSIPGSSWSCGYSGTSMASPHSAGAVALLWSCNSSW